MIRRRLRLGLTTRGSALFTAGLTAAACGVALGQRDLVRVAVLLITAPLLAALALSRSRVSISCARALSGEQVAPGTEVVMHLSLTNHAMLTTGSLMLEDQLGAGFGYRARFTVDSIRGRETRALAYRVPAVGRGRYVIGPLRMQLRDPFGLVERVRSFQNATELTVLPQVDPLPASRLPGAWDSAQNSRSTSVGSFGSDDASIREYRHGDDLRKVHWRSSARTGSMMVRQEERPWHGRTSLLLDTRAVAHRRLITDDAASPGADPRTHDSFEWALSAAASIATHLQANARTVDVVSAVLPGPLPADGRLLQVLATAAPTPGTDLGEEVSALNDLGRESAVIAILGDLDELSLAMLTRTHRAHGMALALLLDVSDWSQQTGRMRDRFEATLARSEIALRSAGWRVHRVTRTDSNAQAWSALLGRTDAAPRSGPRVDARTTAASVRP